MIADEPRHTLGPEQGQPEPPIDDRSRRERLFWPVTVISSLVIIVICAALLYFAPGMH